MIDRKNTAKEIESTSHNILEALSTLEPSQNEVFASHTTQMKVVYENKDFSVSTAHSSTQYGLRTIVNGKLGFMTSNNVQPDSVKAFAKEAQLIASLSPKSQHNHIISDKGGETYFEAFDESLANATPKEILGWSQLMIDEARKSKDLSIDRAEFTMTQTVWSIANSVGVNRQASQTSADWFMMGMGKTESEVASFDYDGSTVWKKQGIEEEIQNSIKRFRESAVGSLGAQKTKSYKGLVAFHPYAVLDLIGEVIRSNCNGNSHADSISPWKNKVGEKVLSEMLDAFEDPTDKGRISGWTPFDREGMLTKRHDIIKEGVLNFIAHNTFSASKMGTKSTGNATGGSRGLPGVGLSNFGIQASKKAKTLTDDEIFGALNNGLVLKRFSGNSDPVSGQFSGVAKNSWVVENGKRTNAVQEVMVAGNIFELIQQIAAVGKNPHTLMGSGYAPYVLIDGVSVTAG